MSVLVLDILQYFPSINPTILQILLCKLGFSPLLCNLINSYYSTHSTRYLWNVFHSKDYDTNNGIPQGDPLSPILSVLYMSSIINKLFPYTRDNSPMCLSYIDDYVLMVDSPSLAANIESLEAAYSNISDAFCKVSLRIEPSKTELCHFARKDQLPPRGRKPIRFDCLFSSLPSITLRSTHHPLIVIAPTKEWRYLGFYFDPFLSFSHHINRYANKSLVVAQNLCVTIFPYFYKFTQVLSAQ